MLIAPEHPVNECRIIEAGNYQQPPEYKYNGTVMEMVNELYHQPDDEDGEAGNNQPQQEKAFGKF